MTIRTLSITYSTTYETQIDIDDFSLSDEELAAIEQRKLKSLGLDYDEESTAEISWDEEPLKKEKEYALPVGAQTIEVNGRRWATDGNVIYALDTQAFRALDHFIDWIEVEPKALLITILINDFDFDLARVKNVGFFAERTAGHLKHFDCFLGRKDDRTGFLLDKNDVLVAITISATERFAGDLDNNPDYFKFQ